ncbi:MAG: PadR family transcriptional regulator, partial [Acidobacteria bacterium]|nr:PadR family transcriptional regulator [Acidobacteriota bacterium]
MVGEESFVTETRTDLLQGTLGMLILKTLTLGPLHGYDIVRRIQQVSDDALQVEEGSLYPALYRMEKRGWIVAEWGLSENNRRAKFYKLTRAGRKGLAEEETNWARLSEAISKV